MQKYFLVLDDKKITYSIKRRRYQKRVNLIVHQDGSLVITTPKMYTQKFVEKIIKKNAQWIIAQVGNRQRYVTIDPTVVNHVKNIARPVIEAKVDHFNTHYNFCYNRISIRHQKTRWGSCGINGNLSFNCKLLCLPEELIDYVVAHELCHLKEMNHSKEFWKLVAITIPDYKERRKKLKNIII